MSRPVYADPVHDGAADPVVIHRAGTDEWWMFYTNRRADLGGEGVGWIHGSAIGVAVSADGGRNWGYRGTVAGLDAPEDTGLNTHWAPEVIRAGDTYHMYLTYMTGTGEPLGNPDRRIVHFTSPDLVAWTRQGVLPRTSHNVIDAAVARTPDGLHRLWYKDEGDGSSTWSLTSPDLHAWTLEGKVIPGSPDAPPHEGPNVFFLSGYWWLIVDEWRGQAVYRSDDALGWQRQGLILAEPGAHPDDRRFARHGDVVTQGDWAALFYFTHPHWAETLTPVPLTFAERRTVIHVARLHVEDGRLLATRDIEGVTLDPALLGAG
ncbi:MAG TPA: hypothetical protein VNX29_16150 [Kaistia sp.]|nr:hypothetical protein [Kaistia sp.]